MSSAVKDEVVKILRGRKLFGIEQTIRRGKGA
ncbi:MAG: hypothetical protein BMS9Abin28_1402 [Anaerolineae bacterium]|nr:MAG: hypothetical protein BMS9Abin28_1402 [Anaerolineae bacterium]